MDSLDAFENQVFNEWDRVCYQSMGHPKKVQRRAYQIYGNWAAEVALWFTSPIPWILCTLNIVVPLILKRFIPESSFYYTSNELDNLRSLCLWWVYVSAFLTFILPFTVMQFVDKVSRRVYYEHCLEDFIWQHDKDYYIAFVQDDEQLTIEEWKPVRYAYHMWQTETSQRQSFKIWYRNQCKNIINFDKYCKSKNRQVI